MDFQLKLIVRDINLRLAARKSIRLPQYHRQSAVRDIDAVFATGKYRADLW